MVGLSAFGWIMISEMCLRGPKLCFDGGFFM